MSEELIKAYHLVITQLEAPKIAKLPPNQQIHQANWYPILNPQYYISKEEIKQFLRQRNFPDSEKIVSVLLQKGYLVQLPDNPKEDNSDKLRSIHMDILVRSSQITTMFQNPPYLLTYNFSLSFLRVPTKRDRTILPENSVDRNAKNLWDSIHLFFKENTQVSNLYISIIKEYLKGSGLDPFQSFVLREMLLTYDNKNTHAIVAPTGSGKTEIYLFYMLALLLRWRIIEKNMSKKVVLVYPRKTLTADQALRMIKLLYIANEKIRNHNLKLTFAIRDGDTPRYLRGLIGNTFRGLTCPICGKRLIYSAKGNQIIVSCESGQHKFDFIKIIREDTGKADIVATNPWALENRLIDNAPTDVDVNVLANASLLVFDEVHEYTDLSGGILSSLIKALKNLHSTGELKLVFSSATIPQPEEFISKISGDDEPAIYDFQKEVHVKNKITISGNRLVILGYFSMNPRYSWNTYCQLWAVLMSFLHYAYEQRNIQPPQSILFVNNIRELKRLHSGFEENLRLGEPKDHLSLEIPSIDPYSYWHYLPSKVREATLKQAEERELFGLLQPRVVEMHSELPQKEREKVINVLNSGKCASVLSTSSLELGVDYKNVSFILNVGLDNPVSLIQRIGRGGRGDETLRTVLGIILAKATPTELLKTYDKRYMETLAKLSFEGYSLYVTNENPQVIKRGFLVESIAKLAKKGEKTHASRKSGGPLSKESLATFIEKIVSTLGEQ